MAGRTLWSVLTLVALVAGVALGEKALVLVDSPELESTHSQFIGDLSDLGLELDVQPIDSSSLRLKRWDEWIYDKLVILGGSKELGGALDAVLLMEFVDAGNDLLLILAPTPTDEMRDVATALGVDLDAAGSRVLDHTRYDAGRGHAAVLGVQSQLARVFSGAARGPLVFSGMGLSVAPTSELTMLALHGAPTAYSAGAGGKPTGLAGCALGLAALAQARNNARALVLAGLDFVSNDLFDASVTDADGNSLGASGNRAAARDLAAWALSRRGVLRLVDMSHSIVGGEVAPERYRIKDEVEVYARIEELVDGQWVGYDASDVKIELVMLDPYIRQSMESDGDGNFRVRVTVPDVYGVFKWVLDYAQPGLSRLHWVETVPIRPFAHNEYDRFILQAYPYYASIFTLMAAFLVSGVAFIYTK